MSATEALASGNRALQSWSWDEARQAFQAAVDEEPSAEAYDGLATAAALLDDGTAAIAAREAAYRLYRERGDDASAARAAITLATFAMDFRAEPAVASGWLERAGALVRDEPDSPTTAAVVGLQGYMAWAFDKDLERALTLCRTSLDIARSVGEIHTEMLATGCLGLVLVSSGSVAEGMRLLDLAAAAAVGGELPDREAAVNVCCFLVTACARVRDYDRTAEWSGHVLDMATGWTNVAMFSIPRVENAEALIWWGRWDEAERHLLGVIVDSERRPAGAAYASLRLADLRRRQGRFDDAEALLDELDARPHRSGLAYHTVAARAALALDRGDPGRALEAAERFLRGVPPEYPVELIGAARGPGRRARGDRRCGGRIRGIPVI